MPSGCLVARSWQDLDPQAHTAAAKLQQGNSHLGLKFPTPGKHLHRYANSQGELTTTSPSGERMAEEGHDALQIELKKTAIKVIAKHDSHGTMKTPFILMNGYQAITRAAPWAVEDNQLFNKLSSRPKTKGRIIAHLLCSSREQRARHLGRDDACATLQNTLDMHHP